jgi:hypothetical protein
MYLLGALLSGCIWGLIAQLLLSLNLQSDFAANYIAANYISAVLTGLIISYGSKPLYASKSRMTQVMLVLVSYYVALALYGALFICSISDPNTGMTYNLWEVVIRFIWSLWVFGTLFYSFFLVPLSCLNHFLMSRITLLKRASID